MKAFESQFVVKHFGKVKALDGVSLAAEVGTVFGLLGPNGAGKTTFVRMLSTLIKPDSGSASVLGLDVAKKPQEVRELIGLAGQFAAIDEFMTGKENLYMVGRLYHLNRRDAKSRAQDILERLGLSDAADRPARTYSGGMRRRLDLGASLVGQPKILFLDEPTTGLDPRTRLELWEIIRELIARGTSILLTTQYLEEADELADQIAVIDHGLVIAEGTSDQLKSRLGGDVVEFELASVSEVPVALRAVGRLAKKAPEVDDTGKVVTVPVEDGSVNLFKVVDALNAARVSPVNFSLHRPSLDDVFLALTGKRTQEEPAQKPAPHAGGMH